MLVYEDTKKRIFNTDISSILDGVLKSKYKTAFVNSNKLNGSTKEYIYTLSDVLNEKRVDILLTILVDKEKFTLKWRVEFDERIDKSINEIHLKMFLLELISKIYTEDCEESKKQKNYIVRTYFTYMCSAQNREGFKGTYSLNCKYKTYLHFFDMSNKYRFGQSEKMLYVDVVVKEINIKRARSVALRHSREVVSYLSMLLNYGFREWCTEHLISTLKIKNELDLGKEIEVLFMRREWVDPELNLVVCNNMNDMFRKEDYDLDDFGNEGIVVLSDKRISTNENLFFSNLENQNNDRLEEVFINRDKPKVNPRKYLLEESISLEAPFNENGNKIPNKFENYFLNCGKYEGFLKSCKLYNTALSLGGRSPTLFVSYLVCSIECLANIEKISYSDFMKRYLADNYNKKLCDYYYSVRSKHFHAGEYIYNEYEVNLEMHTDTVFVEMLKEFILFQEQLRMCLVNWIERNLLDV